ncbi:MAG: thioredoxin-dependent thiol peroxidase [Owenweeksia sp.]|nr:thioredoxin-dependent thiol peroxidase [Owenweeksia sp.]
MTHLVKGDLAPDFEGKDQNGDTVKLSDYRGRKVILYFYPKDNTPGCTMEACNFRDNHGDLLQKGFAVIGVSADSEKKHQNFIAKHDLPFTLIADTDKEVIKAYGVWGKKKFMGREFDGIHRETFVIDENGKIDQVITKVKNKEASQQILEAYA